MIDFILKALSNSVVGIPLLGTIMLGLVSGVVGVFTVLRKQALIGDALSHASLPGVVLMYMFTRSESVSVLLVGAALAAGVSMFLMNVIKKYSKIEHDALLALILSSFFGLGNFLINLVRSSKINLKDYIFGSAATIIRADLWVLIVSALVILIIITFVWRHLKVQTFNQEYYNSLGFSSTIINFIMSFITILVIVVGIKTVGVILMSSFLIAPAIAARMWDNRLFVNALLAALFGAISGFLGTFYSSKLSAPIGPMVVIVVTMIAVISILAAPRRGIIAKEIQRKNYQSKVVKYRDLIHLYEKNTISVDARACHNLVISGHLQIVDKEYKLTDLGYRVVQDILKVGEF